MAAIHLSNIFGLPKDMKRVAYWKPFGNKLISSTPVGRMTWTGVQMSKALDGFPILANGMQFLAHIPRLPEDESVLPALDESSDWIFSNGPAYLQGKGEFIHPIPSGTSTMDERFLHLVLEPRCPDLSGIHSLRKADLLLPSGIVTVFVEDSNEYDLICWKTEMLEKTPAQYRRIDEDSIFVDKSAILNACLYGVG